MLAQQPVNGVLRVIELTYGFHFSADGQPSWPRFEPGGGVLSLQAGGQSAVTPAVAINAAHDCASWETARQER